MVRLKGGDKKSNFADWICISIPYGAIKSDFIIFKKNNFYEFQFLMVRLKALTAFLIRVEREISIPYGAIKRYFKIVSVK